MPIADKINSFIERRIQYLLFLVIPGCLASTQVILATTIHVPGDQPTIQQGIDVAVNGDTVLVAPGMYNEQINFHGKSVVVSSLFLAERNATLISQTTITHSYFPLIKFITSEDPTALLSGFTLTGANVAILCDNGSNPTLMNLNISNNTANFIGAGILCENSSSPIIVNCTMVNNQLLEPEIHGGAIMATNDSHPTLVNTIIWNNITPQISLWHFSGRQPSSITMAYCDIEGGEDEIEIHDGHVTWLQGNIDKDPLFRDTHTHDYRLGFESPCIDIGVDFFVLNGDTLVNLASGEYIGSSPDIGAFEYGSGTDVISEHNAPSPTSFSLSHNYPNPFNPTTTICYTLSFGEGRTEDGGRNPFHTTLKIFNILGQEVRTLVDEAQEPDFYTVIWDGKDSGGRQVASGVYFYRLQSGNGSTTMSMVLLR